MSKLIISKSVSVSNYPNVFKKLSFKVFDEKSRFMDDEFLIMLNDKPKKMLQKNWEKMIKKVLKIEIRNKM